MKYPRHPKYKDSGIEWIGEIPEHWETRRLKFVSQIQFSNVDKHSFDEEIPVKLANYTDVYKNGYITSEMNFMDATATAEETLKFSLNVGDVLVTKDSETPDDIAIPALVKSTIPNLICGYHLAQIRPNNDVIDGGFLFYTYANKTFRGKYESEANGITRFGLSQYSFSGTYVCFPSLKEQLGIYSFLESETSKVDSLISKQQQMIELLKEKRQAIITHAVTKGLDPNVPMKDSGIEWIGEIPETWKSLPLKRLATCNDEVLPETTLPDFEFDYVEISDVNYVDGITKSERIVFGNAPSRARRIVRKGDIIISTVRTYLKAISAVESTAMDLIVSTGFAVIRPRAVRNRFAKYMVIGDYFIQRVVSESTGVSYPAISSEKLISIKVVIPDSTTQDTIADYLDAETKKIDRIIYMQENIIRLLIEHKHSLITQAVTGKIDVRGLVQEVNEPARQTS